MGPFGRGPAGRRRAPRGRRSTVTPDPHFPFLSLDDAARLRSLARAAFAEQGVETEIHETHLQGDDGHAFGLRNLFVACLEAGRSERAWRRTVAVHVSRLLQLREEPTPADLPAEELLAHAVVRVTSTWNLPDLTTFTYRRELGGDLVELLVHDTPTTVAYLTDAEVERVGADQLRGAGVENLLREPFGRLRRVTTPQSGRFTALVGESVHTASRLLTLDDVLRRAEGDAGTPHGLLVAVPNRHQLAFHRPTDASLLGVVHGMLQFALAQYEQGAGALSPHLFWRPPEGGPLEQLTRIDDDSGLHVRIQGRFAEIVQRLVT